MPIATRIRGREGRTLDDVWSGGAQAHRGTTIAGFPNLAYNQALQRRMADTVWASGGCASRYLDAHGNNTTLWPTFTWRFRRATRTFDPTEYRTHSAPP